MATEETFEGLSKAEIGFVNEKARQVLVNLCDHYIRHGIVPVEDASIAMYFKYAIQKGWISKKGDKILSSGWNTAAAFLRR
jgi:hypothetical protein